MLYSVSLVVCEFAGEPRYREQNIESPEIQYTSAVYNYHDDTCSRFNGINQFLFAIITNTRQSNRQEPIVLTFPID